MTRHHVVAADVHTAQRIGELIDAGKIPALYKSVDEAVAACDAHPSPCRYRVFSVKALAPQRRPDEVHIAYDPDDYRDAPSYSTPMPAEMVARMPRPGFEDPEYEHELRETIRKAGFVPVGEIRTRPGDATIVRPARQVKFARAKKRVKLFGTFVAETLRKNKAAVACVALIGVAAAVYILYHPA